MKKTICELCGKDYSIYGNDGVCDECGAEIEKSYCDIAQRRLDNVPVRLEKFIEG